MPAVNMQNLADALAAIKAAVLSGDAVDEIAEEIGGDFEVNPALLRRKFAESYKSEDALRATAAAVDASHNAETRLARAVAQLCKRYGVPVEGARVSERHGHTYTIVCHVAGSRKHSLRGIRHDNFLAYKV